MSVWYAVSFAVFILIFVRSSFFNFVDLERKKTNILHGGTLITDSFERPVPVPYSQDKAIFCWSQILVSIIVLQL